MHNLDIQELLEHSQNEIFSIFEQSKNGIINKVTLKNTLENLRSVLDYAAQDMQSKLKSLTKTKVPEKVYFPYGQRENYFKKSVKRNLPNLSEHMPTIHALVLAMQPFNCGDPWLVDLCGLTNDAKHNNLTKTENKKTTTIQQNGITIMGVGEGKRFSMTGTRINGVLQDDVFADPDGTITIKLASGQTLITENNKIHFQGKKIEVAPFLKTCHQNLSQFSDDLAKELEHT